MNVMKATHKYLLALIFLWGMFDYAKGQNNLIHNAIIEQPINVYSPLYPGLVDDRVHKEYYYSGGWQIQNYGNQTGLDVWTDRLKTKKITDSFGKTFVLLHSPEWFMTNIYWDGPNAYSKLTIADSPGSTIQPHSGEGYIGMGLGELVQQKFFNSNKFEEGESYTLNFYIRPVDNNNIFSNSNWSQGLDLKVYLRKSKMKYAAVANNKNKRCDETKYFKKKNMNNTITVMNHHVDLSSYPTGQWHAVTVEFTAPADNYDWIVIETQGNVSPCDGTYLLLDDFMLAKSCEFPSCDRTAGLVFPQDNGFVNLTTPLTITNLNNVTSATVEVFPLLGQTPIWSYSVTCTDGIQDPIYWDGRATSGSYVANAFYVLKVTYTNDCGTEVFSHTISKSGDYPATTNNIVCNTSNIATPVPCCVYQPDLTLNNIVYPGPGLFDYKVINQIDVAPTGPVTVSNVAEVEMRAGYEIELYPGFTVDAGGYYLAEIVPCTNGGRLRPSDVPSKDFSGTKQEAIVKAKTTEEASNNKYSEEPVLNKFTIKVYPNPSKNGKYMVEMLNSSSSKGYVEVMDLIGGIVYKGFIESNKSIVDISNQPNGIYFIHIRNGDEVNIQKIIKQ